MELKEECTARNSRDRSVNKNNTWRSKKLIITQYGLMYEKGTQKGTCHMPRTLNPLFPGKSPTGTKRKPAAPAIPRRSPIQVLGRPDTG